MSVIKETGGLDDAFVVTPSKSTPIAVLSHKNSGHQVSLYSSRNGLVVYSFNWPEDGVIFSRSNGRLNTKHEGLALEAQTLPDAINHSQFGDIILRANQRISYSIVFAFEKI